MGTGGDVIMDTGKGALRAVQVLNQQINPSIHPSMIYIFLMDGNFSKLKVVSVGSNFIWS